MKNSPMPHHQKSVAGKAEPKVKNKAKYGYEETEYNEYPNLSDIISASECTGVMHTPPQNEEEYEAYLELSSLQIPRPKEDNFPE